MALTVGTRVTHGAEEWLLDAPLATGGFGEIFHATRTRPTYGEAAVKVLNGERKADPVWVQKFKRETRIASQNPPHPNVVQSIAVWQFPDGELALVQEFVPTAKKLSAYLHDPKADRVGLLLQALYALRAVHGDGEEAGIVHRDVSAQNILVNVNTGTVKLIDFGLAMETPRTTEVLTKTGIVFGTPGCVAPEARADPRKADRRSDLWSLGKTFAAALQDRDPQDVELNRLPPPWNHICTALAQHDPSDRPQNADEAIDLVIQATTLAGTSPQGLRIHLDEVDRSGEPKGWAAFAGMYFAKRIRTGELDMSDLQAAARLPATALAVSEMNADALFDAFESGSVGEHFRSGNSSYDGVDPFGTYLKATYPSLGAANQVRAFRALARTAVEYHRFALMRAVRTLYGAEDNPAVAAQLLRALDDEDPTGVIEGRGVIPRRQAA